jgi:hypothetical protein
MIAMNLVNIGPTEIEATGRPHNELNAQKQPQIPVGLSNFYRRGSFYHI